MESIQDQIAALTNKVDSVYQLIQHLNWQQHERTSQSAEDSAKPMLRERTSSSSRQNEENILMDWRAIHQDILIDSNGLEVNEQHFQEYEIAPQAQVQRLTAQLTAAYNRIAALEEQLLAKRWQ
jgi:hypothetical protein